MTSVVDTDRQAQAEFTIRAGYLSLRRIATFFDIPFEPDPHFPDHPITIARAEFDEAWVRLEASGVPMKPDRERAWQDFAGWRVNYDTVLVALATLTMAPYAPWSSDRGLRDWRPPVIVGWRRPRRANDAIGRMLDREPGAPSA
jgi:hypothetical protein